MKLFTLLVLAAVTGAVTSIDLDRNTPYCDPGFYWEINVGCQSCLILCASEEDRRACDHECPGYLDEGETTPEETTTEANPHTSESNYIDKGMLKADSSSDGTDGLSPAAIASVACGVVAVTSILAVAGVWYYRRRKPGRSEEAMERDPGQLSFTNPAQSHDDVNALYRSDSITE